MVAFRFTLRHGNTKRMPNAECRKFCRNEISPHGVIDGRRCWFIDGATVVTVVFRHSLSYVYIGVHTTFIPALRIHISDLLRFLPATAKGTSSRSSLRPKVFTGESEFSMSLYPPDSVPLFNPAACAHWKRRRYETQPGNFSYRNLFFWKFGPNRHTGGFSWLILWAIDCISNKTEPFFSNNVANWSESKKKHTYLCCVHMYNLN